MSSIKSFRTFLLIENFFGIFRNYCSENKTKKCLILVLISIQTILHTIAHLNELHLSGEVDYDQINVILTGFSAIAYLSSLTAIMAAICNSRTFMSYFRSISIIAERFKDDKTLINSLKKTYWFSIGFILYSVVFSFFRSLEALLKFSQISPLILVPILVSQTITRMSIIFQDLMFYIVVMIVVHLLKCLTSLISAVQEKVANWDISSDGQCDITREQIQGWVELYRDLADCCDKVMLCFGRQFFFSIILSSLYYILMSYFFFYKNILKIWNTEEYMRAVMVIFSFVLVMMPLIAAQIAKNQGVKFHRVLVQLYNTIIIDSGEAEAKLIKDFIRLIKKNPIEIRLLSKIPAGMYMLPVILTTVVNYIIAMLQFNHVI